MTLEIVAAATPESVRRICEFRAQVWLEEGLLSPDTLTDGMWLDGHDQDVDTRFWVIEVENQIIAAARLALYNDIELAPSANLLRPFASEVPNPFAFMARLVVRKDFRGKGIAKRMDCLRMNEASKSGAKAVIGLPVSWRVEALKKLGFVDLGELPCDPIETYGFPLPYHLMIHFLESLPAVD